MVPVKAATMLFDGVYSTGPMGPAPEEQALILDTNQGLVILTECTHTGIVAIVREAKRQHGRPIRLVMGGFHLLRQPERQIRATIGELKTLRVSRVAPSHWIRHAHRRLLPVRPSSV